MSGATTIGKGAVVLTANADQLLGGLDKAQKSTEKWAQRTSSAGNKAAKTSGGLFGSLVFGGGALSGGGAALAAVGVGLQLAEKFIDRLSQVGERAQKYGNIDAGTQAGIDHATKGFDRLEAATDGFFFKIAGALAPAIEKIADGFEVVAFVAGELFSDAVDLIGDIVGEVSKWIDETFGLQTASTSATDVMWKGFRFVAQAAGYAWDVIKAGAGVVAVVAGTIVSAFGKVVSIIGEAVKELDNLARELPEALRPDWIGKAAGKIGDFGAKAEAAGDGLTKWGKAAIGSFGETADKAGKYIDGLKDKFDKTDKLAKKGIDPGNLMSGAFAKGGAEAYRVTARYEQALDFHGPGTELKNIPKKSLEEAKKATKLLSKIVSDGPVIRIISW